MLINCRPEPSAAGLSSRVNQPTQKPNFFYQWTALLLHSSRSLSFWVFSYFSANDALMDAVQRNDLEHVEQILQKNPDARSLRSAFHWLLRHMASMSNPEERLNYYCVLQNLRQSYDDLSQSLLCSCAFGHWAISQYCRNPGFASIHREDLQFAYDIACETQNQPAIEALLGSSRRQQIATL